MKQWMKWVGAGLGATIAGVALMLSATMIAYPAISSIAGLAVAQSANMWNNVKDAAAGDSLSVGLLATGTMMYNGVSFDRVRGDTTYGLDVDVTRISGATTPADAYANPTTANQMWSLTGVFNGTTWDRARSATADTLATTGIVTAGNMVWNGTSFDRMRTGSADALAITGVLADAQMGWNGTAYDRVRTASATNNTATTSLGIQQVTPASTWSVINTQAGAVQATASKAAGGGTVRHVATSVTVCRGDTAVAAPALVHLRDGASGAGTIIRSWVIGVSTTNESKCENVPGINMTGTANTAMTIEFAAAGSATSTSTVTLTGYSTP